MRKLLVKLVALETAVLGWLSYWLFLVYANNPSVSQGLANELSRFPQISYTTIDISIIAIIAVFSIVLAIRFDRSLRPGMKLERALQMLESLMKRNLFLEAQLAETRVDKPIIGSTQGQTGINLSQMTGSQTSSLSTSSFSPSVTSPTGKVGGVDSSASSWENAFRIPIEAGPASSNRTPLARNLQPSTVPTAAGSQSTARPVGDSQRQSLEPLKASNQPPSSPVKDMKDDRSPIRPGTGALEWEDSPRRTMETRGIITPSQQPPHKPFSPLSQQAASSSSTGSSSSSGRLPYIPMPPPKAPPSNVVTSAIPTPSPRPSSSTAISSSTTPSPSQSQQQSPLSQQQQSAPSQKPILKTGIPAQARPISKAPTSQSSQSSPSGARPISPASGLPGPVVAPLFQLTPKPSPQQTTPQKSTPVAAITLPPQHKAEQRNDPTRPMRDGNTAENKKDADVDLDEDDSVSTDRKDLDEDEDTEVMKASDEADDNEDELDDASSLEDDDSE